ncbi:MAG TPA: hypothetical protein VJB11_01945 [archaeon]|nr:hypothetical protein [archaeon]
MKIEEHKKALEEHERNIRRCINEGIEENQRNLGYNVSQASIELLSIYLLKISLVPVSVNFDHRIFKNSDYIKKNFSFDFENKEKILGIMRKIEEKRNLLCYGKRKPIKDVEEMIEFFNNLKKIIGVENE